MARNVKSFISEIKMFFYVTSVILVAIFLISPDAAMAAEGSPGDSRAAKAEFDKGVLLYNAEKYEAAARAFRDAYQLKPSWMLHFNIAQSEAAAKHYGRSFEEFEKYLAEGGDDVPEQRQSYVETELERLEGLVGSLEIVGPADAIVVIDSVERGKLPIHGRLKLAVSTVHDVIVKQGEEDIFTTKIQVSRGEVIQLNANDEGPRADITSDAPISTADADQTEAQSVTMPMGSGRPKLSPVFWTGLAGTVATGIASGIMWGLSIKKQQEELDAQDAYDNASQDWEPGNTDDEAEEKALRDRHETLGDEMITRQNVAIALTATTGAFAVLTTVGLIISLNRKPSQNNSVSFGPGGVQVRF
jgi:tetratricopeptide (TPR) repeat protein